MEDPFFHVGLGRFNRVSKRFEYVVEVAVSVFVVRVEWRISPVTVAAFNRQVLLVANAVCVVRGGTPRAYENTARKGG